MQKQELIEFMTELLQEVIEEQSENQDLKASSLVPLVGAEAVITSMGLVSLIADVESAVTDKYDVEINLVNEQALSRKQSPFRTIDTLADYILELDGAPAVD